MKNLRCIRNNVTVLSTTVFCTLVALFSWYNLFPLHLKNLGASDLQIGVIYTLAGLSWTVFQALGGHLADRFGRKPIIAIPTLVFPLFYGLMALTDQWAVAAALYMLANIASAIQIPAFTAVLAESSEEREKTFTWYEALASLGAALGPFLGAWWLTSFDLRALMGLTAGMTLLSAFARLTLLTETWKRSTAAGRSQPLRGLFNRGLLWFFLSGGLLFLATSITLGPFPALHLKEYMGRSESEINLLFGLGWGMAALLSLLGTRIAHTLGATLTLSLSGLLHPACLLAWIFVGRNELHLLPFLLSFVFAQFIFITYQLQLAELTTSENRGRIAGLFGTVTGLISAGGPVAAMQAKLAWGYWLPFGVATVFGVLAFLVLLPVVRHNQQNYSA